MIIVPDYVKKKANFYDYFFFSQESGRAVYRTQNGVAIRIIITIKGRPLRPL